MEYIIAFLEGIITFISPCLLPMLPIYISYFAGGETKEKTSATLKNAVAFVLGFTVVFVTLGAFAGTAGRFLREYQQVVNIVMGVIVCIFGLSFLGVFELRIFSGIKGNTSKKNMGFKSSLLFGIIFSIGWTPCVGVFLGSALMLASHQGSTVKGIIMLLCYSIGLGVPFIISAILIDKLKGTFNFIKRHYNVINLISGLFLLLMGVLMIMGMMGKFLSFISF